MSLAENLRQNRERLKLSQPQLAKLVGVSQSLIAQLESGSVTSTKQIFKLAQVLGVQVHELDPGIAKETVAPRPKAPPVFVSEQRDFPIYSSAEGGRGGIIITWEAVEWTVRPAPLQNVKGGYGIYVWGDSMIPAYEPGDIALVNPNIPPSPQRDVVLFKSDAGNSTEALIKRYIKSVNGDWLVQQWNPASEFRLSRADWPQCQVVIGKYSR